MSGQAGQSALDEFLDEGLHCHDLVYPERILAAHGKRIFETAAGRPEKRLRDAVVGAFSVAGQQAPIGTGKRDLLAALAALNKGIVDNACRQADGGFDQDDVVLRSTGGASLVSTTIAPSATDSFTPDMAFRGSVPME